MVDFIINTLFKFIVSIYYWWQQGKLPRRIGKSALLAIAASYIVTSFLSLFFDLIQAAIIIRDNAKYWMVGDMTWFNSDSFIPVTLFAAFLLFAIIFGVRLIWKSIEPTLTNIIRNSDINKDNTTNQRINDIESRLEKIEKER